MRRLVMLAAFLALGACRAVTAPPTRSPLGHDWKLLYDPARASIGAPPASGDGHYLWCDLHGGHIPRSTEEALDAMRWVDR